MIESETTSNIDILGLLNFIIPGIFALIGIFIGYFLQNRTQFKNWVRQKRSEVFADFLIVLEDCFYKAQEHIIEPPDKDGIKFTAVPDVYSPAYTKLNIVKLFVMKNSRKQIEKLLNDIVALHSRTDLGTARFLEMHKKRDQLHKIFIKNIENPKW